MTKDEALRLALEALKSCNGLPHWPAFIPVTDAIKAALEAKDEPVGFMHAGQVLEMQQGRLPYGYVYPKLGSGASVAIYATPPQRTWVGLSEDQLYEASWQDNRSFLDGAQWAEKTLKENNYD